MRRPILLAALALAAAYAWPMQVTGYSQNAHYALTKALASGVPYIDRTIGEVGDLATGDAARHDGHLYAVKAPGLALAGLPALVVAEAVGMRLTGDPTRGLWVVHLLGAALPAAVLVLLAGVLAERLERGTGPMTAVALGAGTLVLPFATLLFSHVLSAALGFAAFALLFLERERSPRLGLVAAAGAAAGLAVVAEYQLALLAAALAVYAAWRGRPARRLVAFAAGALAGVAPLLAFNAWAFGSLTHTPYEDYWREGGYESGAFVYGLPDPNMASQMLFSALGLVTLTPVLALGLVGLVLLYRRGRRADALVLGGVVLLYAAYHATVGAFGGLGPPRYLITLVPFLALPLATAVRAFPLATVALTLVSAFQMAVITATGPLASYDGEWLSRVVERDLATTAASLVGITGWYSIAPFFAAVLLAVAVAGLSLRPLRPIPRDAALAAAGLAAWALVAIRAPNPWGTPPDTVYALAAAGAAGALVAAIALASRGGLRAFAPALGVPRGDSS
jgi:hypothetical protein